MEFHLTFKKTEYKQMKNKIVYLLLIILVSSCGINSDLMLKTKRNFVYDELPPRESSKEDVLAPNDVINFMLFSNDGFQLVDMTSGVRTELDQGTQGGSAGGGNQMFMMRRGMTYQIEHDGLVKLPILGRVPIAGKTIREAELYLEKLYEEFYNRPFSIISLSNKRVIIFPGDGGKASVVPIGNNNTTLFEALAMTGGVAKRGKAKKIKVIRTLEDGSHKVFKIDLSRIEGLEQGQMIVQANDIIYVEPFPEYAREAMRDLAPIVSLISTILVLITVSNNFR
jgi:polysaccharide biosynthesis/export protein